VFARENVDVHMFGVLKRRQDAHADNEAFIG
jgi:hypothetical protein